MRKTCCLSYLCLIVLINFAAKEVKEVNEVNDAGD
jgi:hypothetical protein